MVACQKSLQWECCFLRALKDGSLLDLPPPTESFGPLWKKNVVTNRLRVLGNGHHPWSGIIKGGVAPLLWTDLWVPHWAHRIRKESSMDLGIDIYLVVELMAWVNGMGRHCLVGQGGQTSTNGIILCNYSKHYGEHRWSKRKSLHVHPLEEHPSSPKMAMHQWLICQICAQSASQRHPSAGISPQMMPALVFAIHGR